LAKAIRETGKWEREEKGNERAITKRDWGGEFITRLVNCGRIERRKEEHSTSQPPY
jgi:hypothetical protein